MADELVMYSTTWCGYCVRLKRFLDREGIPYREVNIEHDEDAAAFVMGHNRGNQTVPTIRFPNDVTLTNPSPDQVLEQLGRTA